MFAMRCVLIIECPNLEFFMSTSMIFGHISYEIFFTVLILWKSKVIFLPGQFRVCIGDALTDGLISQDLSL